MIELRGNFYNHHRVAAEAPCIIGSKSIFSYLYMISVSCWGDLIFSPASTRWILNGPHHVKALSDMLDCLQASPAGLGKRKKKRKVICMQKLEYMRRSVIVWRFWRLANTATARMWKWVCLYVQTCMRVYPSERDQPLTIVTDKTRGCIATV